VKPLALLAAKGRDSRDRSPQGGFEERLGFDVVHQPGGDRESFGRSDVNTETYRRQ
jgi:hypothetical protein